MDGSRISFGAKVLLAFLLTLAVGSFSAREFDANQKLQRQRAAIEIAAARGHLLQQRVDRALSATYALAAILRQGRGELDGFDELAGEMMRLYGGISSLQLAPGGVVSKIVPLAGNEGAIGHDLLNDPKRRKESLAAIASRKLTLAGPFTLRQGGVAVVGRLPVFIADSKSSDRFWGFSIALIRITDLLDAAELKPEAMGDYAFELSRIHPDSGQREVFAHSAEKPLDAPVSYVFAVPNGQWTLSIAPRAGWGSPLGLLTFEVTVVLLVSALITLLIFNVLKQPYLLRREVERRTQELKASNRQLEAEIGERRQAENALRESEARFRMMADTVPVLIWMSDTAMRMIYLNTSWLNFSSRQLDDELRDGWLFAVHDDDLAMCRETLAAAAKSRQPFQIEYRFRRHDGEYRWLVNHGVPRFTPDGGFTGYIGSCIDITDLKEAERVLRASHDELEQRVAERTTALTLEIDERKRVEAALKAEKTNQLKLIGKLESAQNQLLQSEKMAAIGQLAAGVAHEINNPIGFISSNLHTLGKYVDGLLAVVAVYEEQADPLLAGHPATLATVGAVRQGAELNYLREDLPTLLEETQEGVSRVRKIVQDLKDFSHVDAVVWQPADLHRGLDSTLNVVWNELKYKAQVVKEYGTIPEVECIASQINQVFMNLLVNAAHAIDDRGVITLRTGHEGGMVWCEVADTGHGIPAEILQRIFEPFFTTKAVGKGTGLGLSLSYGIVKKHGGRIDVKSEPGRGSVFRVWLPVNRPVETVAEAVPEAA